jgi:hypothetical protein
MPVILACDAALIVTLLLDEDPADEDTKPEILTHCTPLAVANLL